MGVSSGLDEDQRKAKQSKDRMKQRKKKKEADT